MRPRTRVAVVVLSIGVSLPMTGTASAADVDCADFPTQGQAQAVLVADPRDPNGLDGNKNGTACEDVDFTRPTNAGTTQVSRQVSSLPTGGVAAGDGSADDTGVLPYALGGLAFAAAGGCAVAARRSARGSA